VSAVLRTGVVGGGLAAQAVHLPNLARLRDRFTLVAIADVSRKVAEGLAARFAPARAYTEWERMLEAEDLDAVVVCSPNATHAPVVLAALDRGVHVLVEKPLCIAPADAAAICRRRDATGLVVQVGYMKRFDADYEDLLGRLPGDGGDLRFVDVVTYDPWMAREPFVPWSTMIHGGDVPEAVAAAHARSEAEQVERAVGRADPATVRAYGYAFLACLVHDVNLVHGALDRLGLDGPVAPVSAAARADGEGASFTASVPGGAPWHCAWLLLRDQDDFRERASLYFDDGVHELELRAPYQHGRDSYLAELRHFHACVVDGVACRTPAEQGARDVALLRDLFRLTR
jgi:predicted dehydrogenase